MSENICPNTKESTLHIGSSDIGIPYVKSEASPKGESTQHRKNVKKALRRATTGSWNSLSSKDAALLALASKGVNSPLNSPTTLKLVDMIRDSTSNEKRCSKRGSSNIDTQNSIPVTLSKQRRHTIQHTSPAGIMNHAL